MCFLGIGRAAIVYFLQLLVEIEIFLLLAAFIVCIGALLCLIFIRGIGIFQMVESEQLDDRRRTIDIAAVDRMGIGRVCDTRAVLERTVAKTHLRILRCVRPDGADAVVLLAEPVLRRADRLMDAPSAEIPFSNMVGDGSLFKTLFAEAAVLAIRFLRIHLVRAGCRADDADISCVSDACLCADADALLEVVILAVAQVAQTCGDTARGGVACGRAIDAAMDVHACTVVAEHLDSLRLCRIERCPDEVMERHEIADQIL